MFSVSESSHSFDSVSTVLSEIVVIQWSTLS